MNIFYSRHIFRPLPMISVSFITSILFIVFSCTNPDFANPKKELKKEIKKLENIEPMEKGKYASLGAIPLPDGFKRVTAQIGSFGEYLRNLKLNTEDNTVYYYNGKPNRYVSNFAVIKLDVGKQDLQQCADAVMRLRAEYYFWKNDFDKIHFNFTNGDRIDFLKYASGYRASVKGNEVNWYKNATPDTSYKTFRNYMDLIFMYAGSYSLERELVSVDDINQIRQGDVFIRGGFPGHAATVADVAVNETTGERIFMLVESYMPAQSIYILDSYEDFSPWYSSTKSFNSFDELKSPTYTFKKSELKRFKE